MSDIDWARITRELAAPFPPEDLKTKPGRGGGHITYIDARTVAERLDQVVGPQNWHFDWLPMILTEDAIHVVKGTLTIHGISKSDIGDSEKIEPNKGAVSDALKRAAVLWGIGRYLYGMESPQAARAAGQQETRRAQQPQEPRNGHEATPNTQRPANAATVPAGAGLTPDQQATIRNAVAALGWGAPDCTAYLRQFGVARFGELSQEQAAEVIPDLLSKAAEIEAA